MDETSLEIVNAGEMYPKQNFDPDDGIHTVPFTLLSGECPLFRGPSAEGIIIITSYRFFLSDNPHINIPLGVIESVEVREILSLLLLCKDGRSFRCVFESHEDTQKWLKRIQTCIKMPDEFAECFAFRFLTWSREDNNKDGPYFAQIPSNVKTLINSNDSPDSAIVAEAERMGFDLTSTWKLSKINEDYKLCPSYPRYFIIPSRVSDVDMFDLVNYRYSKRAPVVVWRHQQNGCVIARSSQPKMGIWSWRNFQDEKMLESISMACQMEAVNKRNALKCLPENFQKGDMKDMSVYGPETEKRPAKKKLLIIDARSYTAAVTNRAKGGGYECDGYYPNCEVQYMGLANIHAIRNSFNSLRNFCMLSDDQNWLSNLENSKWLHYISGLLRAAVVVVNGVDIEERPVLVHCSDGWDRTPQIVALAEIMMDPYYRTKKGFQVLVEREWLEFGHKFADRCGHPDGVDDKNERSPVFLQWLDCIFQLLNQFQCHFEFNEQYLARLVLHTYSNLFGTFLCNTDQDRRCKYSVPLRTFSIWPILNENDQFHNYLFNNSAEVIRPSCQIRSIKFWSDVYIPHSETNSCRSIIPILEEPTETSEKSNLVKTKSYDNIHNTEHSSALQRRNSDPNLVENAFPETAMYPQLPLEISKPLALYPPVENAVVQNGICNQSDNVIELDDAADDSERTVDTKTSDLSPKSNLVLREPTIDGSTDTLVCDGAIIQELCKNDCNSKESSDDNQSKQYRTVATDTCDLFPNLEDMFLFYFWNLDNKLPGWCRSVVRAYECNKQNNDDSNSCNSVSYTTPNHSRTPSSGFPATPCDDSSDMPNLKRNSVACQVMDFDGFNIVPDSVQDRIKRVVMHYRNKIRIINMELSTIRLEIYEQIWKYTHSKDIEGDDAPSVADSASSNDPQLESADSENSWEMFSTDHGTAGLGM